MTHTYVILCVCTYIYICVYIYVYVYISPKTNTFSDFAGICGVLLFYLDGHVFALVVRLSIVCINVVSYLHMQFEKA